MAASDPAADVPTPTGTLQGVAAFSWDGSAWQPTGRAGPSVATPTGVLRGVAVFNGGPSWQPSGLAQPGVATPSGTLDGVAVYTWSGAAWTPPGGTATPSTPHGALRGVAAFNWDGAAWQPASQAGPSVATPYGVLDGVAMFNWTGSAWAAVGAPSLSLDFTTPGTLDPRITFTRASTATYSDATGTLQTAAVNAPRWDYDPVTHALRGLLIEEPRTNVLLNSATLGTQSVAVTAQAYTLSFSGTGTITKSGTASGALVGTGSTQRVSQTFTPTAGTLTLTVTGTVTNAQLEAGSFITSWVPTTASAVTRAGDVCSLPTGAWFNSNTTSLMMEIYCPVSPPGAIGGFGDGANFGNSFYLENGPPAGVVRAGGGNPTNGSLNVGAVNKMAATNTATQVQCSTNGSAVASAAQSASALATTTTLAIGFGPWTLGSGQVDGHIRRVQCWPRVLSNAEMQQVTT